MSTARYGLGGAGIQTSALGFGGDTTGSAITGATEEFTDPVFAVQKITTS
jgi:hypothetical protein